MTAHRKIWLQRYQVKDWFNCESPVHIHVTVRVSGYTCPLNYGHFYRQNCEFWNCLILVYIVIVCQMTFTSALQRTDKCW